MGGRRQRLVRERVTVSAVARVQKMAANGAVDADMLPCAEARSTLCSRLRWRSPPCRLPLGLARAKASNSTLWPTARMMGRTGEKGLKCVPLA